MVCLQRIPSRVRSLLRLSSLAPAIGCCLHSIATLSAAEAAPTSRPNIVFILTDDMGYGDPGCYGGKFAPTPNMDRLAREGIRFTQFYVASLICSASRTALLTWMYPARWRITSFLQTRKGNRACEQADFLDPKAPSLARTLQAAGYATGHFGKWHMGGGRDVTNAPPFSAYGFDEHASTWESPDPHPDITATNWIWSPQDKVKRWDRSAFFVEKTLDFLKRHRNQPCYVNLWPDDVHTPWVPSQERLSEYPNGPEEERKFRAVLDEYDRQVGRFLAGLKELGLEENTLVVFSSDNGPLPTFRGARAGGLRGSKLSLYEGGIRMPFIVRWTGHTPVGRTDDQSVLHAVDLFPSLCTLAGAPRPKDAALDGGDYSAALLGRPAAGRAQPLFWEYGRNEDTFAYPKGRDRSPNVAVREGNWKLLINADGSRRELYDIVADPKETADLADKEPSVADNLATGALAWRKSLPGPPPASATAKPSRPDILFVMSDNKGFSGIGCYGSEIRMPNLDALAENKHSVRHLANGSGISAGKDHAAVLRMEADPACACISLLGWDTEDGSRAATNLLRQGSGATLRIRVDGKWQAATGLPTQREAIGIGGARYRVQVAADAELVWLLQRTRDRLALSFSSQGRGWESSKSVELVFPFNPRVTPTTVLPRAWELDGSLRLPAIISAPDFGQMLLACKGRHRLKARLEGSRAQHTVDLIVELPKLGAGQTCRLSLTPVRLPAPHGLRDQTLWQAARRGWFGSFQPTARWGDPGNPYSAPPGLLANNVISDPASSSLWFYADQAFWTPTLAPGISIMDLVRRTLDWWLDQKMLPTGEMICYWDKTHFLDANAGPLIAAWDYVEATGDRAWLAHRIERLECIAEFLARRDVDGDGLVEAVQSGNSGTLREPARSCAWWDALNCGHKDTYSNALIYRAWRCLADLEARLKRRHQQARYTQLAEHLKAAYFPTLFNPQTGWLAWWKSADGELHDYASPVVNGLAIEYGLVQPAAGRDILARLRRKMQQAGFTRFDLGVPPMLVPVPRGDYLLPDAAGCPRREDGTDTFGYYMNGGITAGQVLHFLAAHYVLGEREQADAILRAMLSRQAQGRFQNGAVNEYPKGIDWTTWDGKPAGYEGYLSDSFRFLQAVLLRAPEARTRLYRPLKL